MRNTNEGGNSKERMGTINKGALLKFKFSKKTYLIVIKDETGLVFKMNDSTLFVIGSYAQKLVASY